MTSTATQRRIPPTSPLRIYHWMASHGRGVTAWDLAEWLGTTCATARRRMRQMHLHGYVEPAGWEPRADGPDAGRWRAVPLADLPVPERDECSPGWRV